MVPLHFFHPSLYFLKIAKRIDGVTVYSVIEAGLFAVENSSLYPSAKPCQEMVDWSELCSSGDIFVYV